MLFNVVGYIFSGGYVYCFLPNIPRAMFIQGATFIPESRVFVTFQQVYRKLNKKETKHKSY